MALTWSGSLENNWREEEEEEEESMDTMRAPLQAVITAFQPKHDAAFADLQRQLNVAIMELDLGRAREAALLRRARKAEEAEEALASQMADLEAEAFTRITQANKLLGPAAYHHVKPGKTSQIAVQVSELTIQLHRALEKAGVWEERCQDLEEEAKVGRVREAAFQKRAEMAEAAQEVLSSQITELKAEAFSQITKVPLLVDRCVSETAAATCSQMDELERQLAATREELEAVRTKLQEVEEKSSCLEMHAMAQLITQEEEKKVTLKNGDGSLLSLTLEDRAGVKVKLWNPSSLALTSH